MKYSKELKFKYIMLDLLHKLTLISLDFLIKYGAGNIPAGRIEQVMGPPV